MATVEDFILKINVQGQGTIKSVNADIGNLKKDIEGLSQVGGPLGNSINGIVSKLGPLGVAASLAGAALVGMGSRALQIAGELSDISGATGIATGQIQNFQTSLIAAGGKAEDASNILSKLNQSVQEAAGGNEKLQQAFRDLGVFVTDANGKLRPTGDILQDITEKAQRGEITQQAYAAAVDILGKNINKLELSKLSALRDPVADADIRRLDSYNEALDRVRDRLSRGIVTFFGSVAEQAEKAFAAMDAYDKKVMAAEERLNAKGLTSRVASPPGQPMSQPIGSTGLPDWMQRQMTAEEKAFMDQQKRYSEQEKLMSAYRSRMGTGRDGTVGGFGEESAESIAKKAKAAAELELKIFRSLNEEKKNILLQFAADEEAAINVRYDAELALSRKTITDKQELAAKIREIESSRDLDVYNFRTRIQEQQSREELKRKEDEAKEVRRIEEILGRSKAVVEEQTKLNDVLASRNKFLTDNVSATDRERQNAETLFDLEQERLSVLKQISQIKDLPAEQRAAREVEINAVFAQRRILTEQQQAADVKASENFSAGFEKAYATYVENSRNAFAQAATYFDTFTKGFEDAFVKMVQTGKLSFKDLIGSMIQELARAQIRQAMANIFGAFSNAPQKGGNGLFGGSIIPGFLANGGNANPGRPYIVGEQGPELFIPRTGGTVIPNGEFGSGGGGSMVTYNINAVDAPSFKAMIARDPSFIHAVAMQGASGMPIRR